MGVIGRRIEQRGNPAEANRFSVSLRQQAKRSRECMNIREDQNVQGGPIVVEHVVRFGNMGSNVGNVGALTWGRREESVM